MNKHTNFNNEIEGTYHNQHEPDWVDAAMKWIIAGIVLWIVFEYVGPDTIIEWVADLIVNYRN